MYSQELKIVLLPIAYLCGPLVALWLGCCQVFAFDARQQPFVDVHDQIIKEALAGTICEPNLQVIALGAASEGASAGSPLSDDYRHFRDKSLLKTLNYIEREKRKVLNFCTTADVDQKSRIRALYHFGLILHTLQDFYSSSNYIELKLEQLRKQRRNLASEDLFNMPLVDWNSMLSLLRNGEKTNIVVEGFDKADPTSPEAKLTAGGVTYFALAKELAVRETERQWHQLASLIKASVQGNAVAVTISLEKAGCPEQVVSDVLKDGDNLVPEI